MHVIDGAVVWGSHLSLSGGRTSLCWTLGARGGGTDQQGLGDFKVAARLASLSEIQDEISNQPK